MYLYIHVNNPNRQRIGGLFMVFRVDLSMFLPVFGRFCGVKLGNNCFRTKLLCTFFLLTSTTKVKCHVRSTLFQQCTGCLYQRILSFSHILMRQGTWYRWLYAEFDMSFIPVVLRTGAETNKPAIWQFTCKGHAASSSCPVAQGLHIGAA